MPYLDNTGLARLVQALKARLVPITRTINGKALSANVALTAGDVNAMAATKTFTAAEIGVTPPTGMTSTNTQAAIAELQGSKVPADDLIDIALPASVWSVETSSGLTFQDVSVPAITSDTNHYDIRYNGSAMDEYTQYRDAGLVSEYHSAGVIRVWISDGATVPTIDLSAMVVIHNVWGGM